MEPLICFRCRMPEIGMIRMPDEEGEYWCGGCIRAALARVKGERDKLDDIVGRIVEVVDADAKDADLPAAVQKLADQWVSACRERTTLRAENERLKGERDQARERLKRAQEYIDNPYPYENEAERVAVVSGILDEYFAAIGETDGEVK